MGRRLYISTSESHLFLVFRGTEELSDIKADLRYVKVDFPGGGRVHVGFHSAFRMAEDAIAAGSKNHQDKPWAFTGHSLGAALALLAAARWKPAVAYLYGCPRVGNKAFVGTIECPMRRFENRDDLVTRLPPPADALPPSRQARPPRRFRPPRKGLRGRYRRGAYELNRQGTLNPPNPPSPSFGFFGPCQMAGDRRRTVPRIF